MTKSAQACDGVRPGRSRRGGQLQCAGAGRDRGPQGGRRACLRCAKARGAKRAVMLPVSAPFHSSLLAARDATGLRERLAEVPIAAPHSRGDQQRRRLESSSIPRRSAMRSPARPPARCAGSQTITRMASEGVTHVIECGPGRVLSGLTKRIVGTLESLAITDAASLADVRSKLGHEMNTNLFTATALAGEVALVTGASRGIGARDRRAPWRAAARPWSALRHRRRAPKRSAHGLAEIGATGRGECSTCAMPRVPRRWSIAIASRFGKLSDAGQQRRHHPRHAGDAHEGRRLGRRASTPT